MPKWTDYTIKTNPADNDEVMVLDTAGKANKRLGLSALSDWIIGKIANKVFENLQTQNKTILGAINELNSNSFFAFTTPAEISIINNKSAKVGRVVYVSIKVKIISALTSEVILKFTNKATNYSTTFMIGKGTEWNITDVAYAYVGESSIVVGSKSSVSIGDYLHINTVLLL